MKNNTILISLLICFYACSISSKGFTSESLTEIGESADSLYITGPEKTCKPFVGITYSKYNCFTLHAEGGNPNHEYNWKVISGDVIIERNNSSECRVCITTDDPNGEEYAEIQVSQIINGIEVTARHTIQIQCGYYYFYPDCQELKDEGLISEEEYLDCVDDLDDCLDEILASDCNHWVEVSLAEEILSELIIGTSDLADPDIRANPEPFLRLWNVIDKNGETKPKSEWGKLSSFVKELPCVQKWNEYNSVRPELDLFTDENPFCEFKHLSIGFSANLEYQVPSSDGAYVNGNMHLGEVNSCLVRGSYQISKHPVEIKWYGNIFSGQVYWTGERQYYDARKSGKDSIMVHVFGEISEDNSRLKYFHYYFDRNTELLKGNEIEKSELRITDIPYNANKELFQIDNRPKRFSGILADSSVNEQVEILKYQFLSEYINPIYRKEIQNQKKKQAADSFLSKNGYLFWLKFCE